MKSTYKILMNIALLVLILISSNYVYKYFFLEKDIQQYSSIINLVRSIPDSADIIYLGESSNTAFSENDLDKRVISEFISDYYPDLNVFDITKPASHAGIYKTLISNIPEKSNVKTLVVTLNIRSFNAQWIYSELETPLQKSMVLLKDRPPIINRALLSFKAYDIKTKSERERQVKRKWKRDILYFPDPKPYKNVTEWDGLIYKNGIMNNDGSRNNELTNLSCHYIKGYAFQIDTANDPRINDFNEIIEIAEKRGWNLIFNLLAENTSKAQELIGKDLIYLFEQNRSSLIHYFKNKGITVVDNLNKVEDEQFIDKNWTTEHYAEQGRKVIANNVALSLKNFHPENYININYPKKDQTSFFNNCERNTIWKNMQTITNENSFSGKYSSKTGNGNKYSIMLEHPLYQIPDSIKNSINISFKFFQHSNIHDGKLVIQTEGNDIENSWNGIPLLEQTKKINVWEDFNYIFQIPKDIKNAKNIKIYIYNTSNESILIDDFHVEFN